MKCEACNSEIDATQWEAKQGSTLACPSCGKLIKVKYTIKDELRDPVGAFVFRDLKYVSKPLTKIVYVVYFIFACLLIHAIRYIPEAAILLVLLPLWGLMYYLNHRRLRNPPPNDQEKD